MSAVRKPKLYWCPACQEHHHVGLARPKKCLPTALEMCARTEEAEKRVEELEAELKSVEGERDTLEERVEEVDNLGELLGEIFEIEKIMNAIEVYDSDLAERIRQHVPARFRSSRKKK